jgi:lipoyl(octanoyl) transferase
VPLPQAVSWALLTVPPGSARRTMAVDEALLGAAVERGRDATLVRLYRWADLALSVGAKQEVPRDVLDRCAAAGVEIVRRPTGGGAVLHVDDLTYAVVAPERGMGVLGIYRWVAEGLVAGFAALGLEASVVEHAGGGSALACFALPTGADLEVGGRKICGSAQVRRSGWFLQHGSIPVGDVRAQTAELLGLAAPDDSTCVDRERPGTRWDEVAAALGQGFRTAWGDPSGIRSLDGSEQALALRLERQPERPLERPLERQGDRARAGLRGS